MPRWVTILLVVLPACGTSAPCGWDEHFTEGDSFDIELIELYTPASTTASYTPALGLTRPAETCGALDEIEVGAPLAIRLIQGPSASQRCSDWFAELVEPVLLFGPRPPLLINNQSFNGIYASGWRDFGGGCEGAWEVSFHAEQNDPFVEQDPLARPVLMAYRVFGAAEGANAACAALAGREPADGQFVCGDAFVASMTRR